MRKAISIRNQPVANKVLHKALMRFIEYHPPARFNRNLRRMLFDYLLTEGAGEGLYFQDLLYDLAGLFELLDEIEAEGLRAE